jgi:hypothetical protein
VRDVAAMVDSLPAPPVLIGHSMGGFVVQKYLEDHVAPGAVLMCAVPPQGLMSAALGLMFSKPSLMKDMNNLMSGGKSSIETLREALFAQEVSLDDLKRYYKNSQSESHRAIWDMSLFGMPRTASHQAHAAAGAGRRIRPPDPVLAGRDDGALLRRRGPHLSRHGPRPDAGKGLAAAGAADPRLAQGDRRVIITFQSPASGDVIMFGDVAKRMMKLMGKEPSDKGIVTVEQLPDAIARIKAAIEEDKRDRAGRNPEDLPQTEKAEGGGSRPYVSLSQRALPLLELLEWSLKKQKPVVWGV